MVGAWIYCVNKCIFVHQLLDHWLGLEQNIKKHDICISIFTLKNFLKNYFYTPIFHIWAEPKITTLHNSGKERHIRGPFHTWVTAEPILKPSNGRGRPTESCWSLRLKERVAIVLSMPFSHAWNTLDWFLHYSYLPRTTCRAPLQSKQATLEHPLFSCPSSE